MRRVGIFNLDRGRVHSFELKHPEDFNSKEISAKQRESNKEGFMKKFSQSEEIVGRNRICKGRLKCCEKWGRRRPWVSSAGQTDARKGRRAADSAKALLSFEHHPPSPTTALALPPTSHYFAIFCTTVKYKSRLVETFWNREIILAIFSLLAPQGSVAR